MTAIIASNKWIAGDTFITYEPSFSGEAKVWVADGSAWGAAGDSSACSAFKLWTEGRGKKPNGKKSSKVDVLQLSPQKGLFLWSGAGLPMLVEEEFYAIGTGGAFALGALCAGASPLDALEISAKWSPATRLPGHIINVTDIPKRKRRGK